MTLAAAIIFACCVTSAIAVCAWAESQKRPLPVPDVDLRATIYIRCNDWEFIPATVADLEPGDTFVMPDFYQQMQDMEAADKAAAANREFWARVAEADLDDDLTPGDNWPTDFELGAGDA